MFGWVLGSLIGFFVVGVFHHSKYTMNALNVVLETHLPGWLEWMINEEEKTSNTLQHSFIKEQKRKRGILRLSMGNQAYLYNGTSK